MVQALLNNINTNNIKVSSNTRSKNFDTNDHNDFDKLFKKQNEHAQIDINSNSFEIKNKKNLKQESSNKNTQFNKIECKNNYKPNNVEENVSNKNSEINKENDIKDNNAEEIQKNEQEALENVENFSEEDNDIFEEQEETEKDKNTNITDNIQNLNNIIIPSFNSETTDSNTQEYNYSENDLKATTKSLTNGYQNILNSTNSLTLKNFEPVEASEDVPTTLKSEMTEKDIDIEETIDEEILNELNIEEIETDSDFDSNDDNMFQQQGQSPQEQSLKATLQTDIDFADIQVDSKVSHTANNLKSTNKTEVTPSRIFEQISQQMEGIKNNSKVNIVLNPEALGKVSVQIVNTKEGLQAQFTVATQDAKNLIMKGLDSLKDNLLAHGINIDNVTVKMNNNTPDSKYNSDWTEQEGSRGGNKEQQQHKEQNNKEEFEKTMFFITQENG